MSIKTNPTAPTNTTKTVASMSEADMIKEAWGFDPSYDIYFYIVLGVAYAGSFIPSYGGSILIAPARWALIGYLLYDCIVRFLDLDKKPKDQSQIWNITNWALYSLRRVAVEYFAMLLNVGTTTIPVLSFVLNLIPFGLSYVNLFVL